MIVIGHIYQFIEILKVMEIKLNDNKKGNIEMAHVIYMMKFGRLIAPEL